MFVENKNQMDFKHELNLLFIGSALSFLVQFINKFIWSDWQFACSLVVLIAIDTLTGTWVAIKNGVFNSKSMSSTVQKVAYYSVTLIVIHTISNITTHGVPNPILAFIVPYLDATMYAYIVLREVVSIAENIGKLGFNIFPVWIMKRLKDFNEEGKYTPYHEPINQNSTINSDSKSVISGTDTPNS